MNVRRLIACILLPSYLVACTTWKTQEASPQQVLAEEQPDKVQVTLTDGSQLVLEEPAVSGDTLSGDVLSIAVKKTDPTAGAVLGVIGTVVLVGAIAAVIGASCCRATW